MGLGAVNRIINNTKWVRSLFKKSPSSKIPLAIGKRPEEPPILLRKPPVPVKQVLNRNNVIAKFCSEQGLVVDDVIKQFDDIAQHLDEVSVERLLKLTNEGKINLISTGKKEKIFLTNRNCDDRIVTTETKGILNYVNASDTESCFILKELLALEKQRKISSENIAEVLKLYKYDEFDNASLLAKDLVKKLNSGEILNNQIKQAQFMAANGIPFEVFNPKNLAKYPKDVLREWSLMFQACRNKEAISPEMSTAINKELMALIRVNRINPTVSKVFLYKFDDAIRVFEKETLSIDNLAKAGGVNLQYTREAFKANILKEIEHSPIAEQSKILSKFGLSSQSNGIMSGLPVSLNPTGLNKTELAINEHIVKFLSAENKVVLPQGFEELAPFMDDLCKAIPEFKFTIGAMQHKTQNYKLAEHMLKAFQENMKNPLYRELGASDRRILGISTLLHDINKIERIETLGHALPSSQTVNAIVERMTYLTPMEKNRIINLVKNHHWLEKISDDPKIIEEMIITFRSGNDFKLAKIFAESDLKAVNNSFFENYGHKINSKATQAVEEGILNIQSKGRMMFTATVNTQRAIENGAVIRTVGSDTKATRNLVIDAEQMGLGRNYFGYHAANDDGLITVISSGGYDKGLGLSLSIGKNGKCAVFNDYKQFVIFDQLNMNNLGLVAKTNSNTKYGKSVDKILGYMKNDNAFANRFRENYPHQISDKDYALLFREVQGLELSQVAKNKNIQRILGSEAKAKDFQLALEKTNPQFVSSAERHSETVGFDMYAGAVGIKGKAEDLSFKLRKFLEERNIPIVENIK